MRPFYLSILILLSLNSYAQVNPCHCLKTNIKIHEKGQTWQVEVDKHIVIHQKLSPLKK